jgi:signal transduction histidine kinase
MEPMDNPIPQDRQEPETALRVGEELYRSLFGNMRQGCLYGEVTFSGEQAVDFRIVDVNQPFEALTGWCEAAGRKASDLIPELQESCAELLAILGRVVQTGVPERAEIRLGLMGVWVALDVFPLHSGLFLAMTEDITTRKWEELLGRESVALAAKAQLSAYVAHEINGPLAGIKSAFTLLGTAVAGDHMYRPYVDLVNREIDRISDTVRMMYELHRPKDSKSQKLEVITLLQDVAKVLEPKLSKHKITLQMSVVEPGLQGLLPADLLRQVIFNLLNSAVDVTPPKGIVSCRAHRDGGFLELQVRDQGPGIPPELADRIWEPGFTVNRNAFQGGLGLGLPTSKRLLESMRGTIHFQNVPDGGCIFIVRIPMEETDPG